MTEISEVERSVRAIQILLIIVIAFCLYGIFTLDFSEEKNVKASSQLSSLLENNIFTA